MERKLQALTHMDIYYDFETKNTLAHTHTQTHKLKLSKENNGHIKNLYGMTKGKIETGR